MYSILIVDDDAQVCRILHDLFTHEGYKTDTAGNGQIALEMIQTSEPDLIISDIQMPVMDGFELLKIVRRDYPHIKHVMMTSFDIDQYIEHIQLHNVGNVLAKGSDFSLSEVAAYIRALLGGDIFGLKRYFPKSVIYHDSVKSYAEAKMMYPEIIQCIPRKQGFFLEIALDELISNAIFHGALEVSALPREKWSDEMVIPGDDSVKIAWASDSEKIGISIEDPSGKLKKMDVLKWLNTYRQVDGSEEHGRGFLLVRKIIDRLVINIASGKRTECIIVQYLDRDKHTSNKPLLIHEI